MCARPLIGARRPGTLATCATHLGCVAMLAQEVSQASLGRELSFASGSKVLLRLVDEDANWRRLAVLRATATGVNHTLALRFIKSLLDCSIMIGHLASTGTHSQDFRLQFYPADVVDAEGIDLVVSFSRRNWKADSENRTAPLHAYLFIVICTAPRF